MLKKFLFISIFLIVNTFCSELVVASLSNDESIRCVLNKKQKENIDKIKALYQKHIEKQKTYLKNNKMYSHTLNTVILSEVCRAFVDINPYEISGRYYNNSFIVEFLQSEGFLKPEKFTRANFNYLLLINVLKFMRDSKDDIFSENIIEIVAKKIKQAHKTDDSVYDYSSNICQDKLKQATNDIKKYFEELNLYDFVKNIKRENYKVNSYYGETYEIVARGMTNAGGTCYFNSVIQFLVTSKKFISLVNFLAQDPRNKASVYLRNLFNEFRKHDKALSDKAYAAIHMNAEDIKKFLEIIEFTPKNDKGQPQENIDTQNASEVINKILDKLIEEDLSRYKKEFFEDLEKDLKSKTKNKLDYEKQKYAKDIPGAKNTKQERAGYARFITDLSQTDESYKTLTLQYYCASDKLANMKKNITRRTACYNTLGQESITKDTCLNCGKTTKKTTIDNQLKITPNDQSTQGSFDFNKTLNTYITNDTEIIEDYRCEGCNKKTRIEMKIEHAFKDLLLITFLFESTYARKPLENIRSEIKIDKKDYELVAYINGGTGHWNCYAYRSGKLWLLDDDSAEEASTKEYNRPRELLYRAKK